MHIYAQILLVYATFSVTATLSSHIPGQQEHVTNDVTIIQPPSGEVYTDNSHLIRRCKLDPYNDITSPSGGVPRDLLMIYHPLQHIKLLSTPDENPILHRMMLMRNSLVDIMSPIFNLSGFDI